MASQILHWFTGTPTQLKKAIDIGCWFSVGPAMLNTKRGVELASIIPRNRILTETDGPFAKHLTQSLFPWDVDLAAKQLAQIWKCADIEANAIIMANFKQLLTS